MLALSLRQAAKNQPQEVAKDMHIPDWNDAGVREVVQEETGPFYIACAHATKLDEIATQTYYGHPDDIARLAYAVANKINNQLATVLCDEQTETLSSEIAEALLAARKPLIVSGISLFSQAIIESAATLSYALKDHGKEVGLVYVVPEVNTIGLSMLTNKYMEDAFEHAKQQSTDTLIILENDLYQRIDKKSTDTFINQHKNIIALDYLENATTEKATYILPAGTFAEADGTVINNEGRAQRFYQVHIPDNDVTSSWKWLHQIMPKNKTVSGIHFDDILHDLIKTFPELQAISSLAPSEDSRKGTQKIPREPHRYSGRTSMHAQENVNEPTPPQDPDSAMSFTMEGYAGIPSSAITPFYWSPGWNSVQAINKYQIEVGGALHDGNPGKRIFEPSENNKSDYFRTIPLPFIAKTNTWLALPLYHIFGSDELSAQSPAVTERVPLPYVALNANDAHAKGLEEDMLLEILLQGEQHRFPIKIKKGIPTGTIGIPKGLKVTAGIQFPFWTTFNALTNE
jgi:NADH-quinone oxidoreductase subunit G